MATQNIKVRSGNRVEVFLDNKKVGLVKSVRLQDNYGLEAASGIGDIHVQEHVPTVAQHSITVQQMVLIRGAIRQLTDVAIENGDKALEGLVFDIVVSSKDDGTVLRKYIGCSYDSGDVEINAHQILMSSGSFKALDVRGTSI